MDQQISLCLLLPCISTYCHVLPGSSGLVRAFWDLIFFICSNVVPQEFLDSCFFAVQCRLCVWEEDLSCLRVVSMSCGCYLITAIHVENTGKRSGMSWIPPGHCYNVANAVGTPRLIHLIRRDGAAATYESLTTEALDGGCQVIYKKLDTDYSLRYHSLDSS